MSQDYDKVESGEWDDEEYNSMDELMEDEYDDGIVDEDEMTDEEEDVYIGWRSPIPKGMKWVPKK